MTYQLVHDLAKVTVWILLFLHAAKMIE